MATNTTNMSKLKAETSNWNAPKIYATIFEKEEVFPDCGDSTNVRSGISKKEERSSTVTEKNRNGNKSRT